MQKARASKYYRIREIAHILRKEVTRAEEVLWPALRKNSLLGFKFRRQAPIYLENLNIIADFFCPKLKLVIEVDGSIHNLEDVKEYDNFKEKALLRNGYQILRFKNKEVFDNLKLVVNKIKSKINSLS